MDTIDYAGFRTSLLALVESSEHVVITSHFSPDDDSIGSVLSTYTILTGKYPAKDIRIIYTGDKVERYNIFTNFDKIQFVPDVAHELNGVNLLIVLDGSQYARFTKFPELFSHVPNIVAIDHHANVPDAFVLSHIVQLSSNCENLYRIFNEGTAFSKEISEHMLLGILGDTGNFAYVTPAQTEVFSIAKTLIDTIGMSINMFRSRYGGIPKRIIPLLQELVKNTQYATIAHWPDFQYTYIDRTVLEAENYTDEDMSAASHIYMGQYIPRVLGYGWGFVLTPRNDGGVRMSSRSLGTSVNVRELHERLGIGSGHDRAAGGAFKKETVDREPKQCIVEVLDWMEHNVPL
jgi:phosphoesterase RecJ-like protein